MDLSLLPLAVTLLFIFASIFVAVGFKTRLSMAALAASLLVSGVFFGLKSSLAAGIVAAGSAMLPIGAYYSMDRYLAVRATLAPYLPKLSKPALRLSTLSIITGTVFAIFIVGGPAYNQMFHHDSKYFLQWHMYHFAGDKVVNAHFFHHGEDGTRRDLDYMTVLGHKTRSNGVYLTKQPVLRDMQIVGEEQLGTVVERVCRSVEQPATVRLEARIATLHDGWRSLFDGTELICSEIATGPKS